MSLHTLAQITFIVFCMNEVRGLFETYEWTLGRIVLGIPASICAWVLVVWVLFYL